MHKFYDIIILGAGAAGLSAGLYGARAKAKTLIIEKGVVGGVITSTSEIANYPGQTKEDSGTSLMNRMKEQAESFGAEIIADDVLQLELDGAVKKVVGNKDSYEGKTVILAMGGLPRKIGCKGEESHIGMGISYCATCDGAFFTDLEVYVVGGGDAALEEADYLTKFARKVSIVHRRDAFRAAKSLQEKVEQNDKISVILDHTVEEVKGDGPVDELVLKNTKTGEISVVKANPEEGLMGVFGFVGYIPNSELLKDIVTLDSAGYVIANERMETNLPGVFAAGDIRQKELRQLITAAADGAIAAVNAAKYAEEN